MLIPLKIIIGYFLSYYPSLLYRFSILNVVTFIFVYLYFCMLVFVKVINMVGSRFFPCHSVTEGDSSYKFDRTDVCPTNFHNDAAAHHKGYCDVTALGSGNATFPIQLPTGNIHL